jgi:MoxR-like ATPase
MLQLQLGYPSLQEEEQILQHYERSDPMLDLQAVVSVEALLALRQQVSEVHVSGVVRGYMLQLVRSTREHSLVVLGVSPRGSLALFRASQALAALRGRDFVVPSDVQTLCSPLLTHRIHISPQTRLRGRTPQQIVTDITESTPVPVNE